jgi:hypothetical protein
MKTRVSSTEELGDTTKSSDSCSGAVGPVRALAEWYRFSGRLVVLSTRFDDALISWDIATSPQSLPDPGGIGNGSSPTTTEVGANSLDGGGSPAVTARHEDHSQRRGNLPVDVRISTVGADRGGERSDECVGATPRDARVVCSFLDGRAP